MPLPNPTMSFQPFDPLPASDLNKMVANDQSLAAGTGLADGAVTPAKWANPYKFSAYRAAALSNNGVNPMQFDTELYDTNSNFDVPTNKGRYTAPVTGYYAFSARAEIINAGATQQRMYISLYRNGTELKRGVDTTAANSSGLPVTATFSTSGVYLTVGQYAEIYMYTSGGLNVSVGATNCYFDGHLVSVS